MCAGQFESRIIVIEGGRFPRAGGMALRAVGAELSAVGIVLGVARAAVLRCAFEDAVYVAGDALNADMRPGEFEGGVVVIEIDWLPGVGGMALPTIGAKLAFVRVIF